jgi:hypothetical protein
MNYLDDGLEALIIKALRQLSHADEAEERIALDYADALENDTWLLETSIPPDETVDWPHINERLAPKDDE